MLKLSDLRPLLAAIVQAEEISCEVAARQARLAPGTLAPILQRQSRQEAVHATTFRAALQCLPGAVSCPAPLAAALQAFRLRLLRDLDQGALAASMLGLQCVLERLACVALQPPPGELARLADAAVPLRPLVLHHESGHLRIGDLWVPRLAAARDRLEERREEYLGLAHAVLEAGLGTLSCLEQDSVHYRAAAARELDEIRLACAQPST